MCVYGDDDCLFKHQYFTNDLDLNKSYFFSQKCTK